MFTLMCSPGQLKGELEASRASSRSNEADIRCAALEAELRVLKRHEEEVSLPYLIPILSILPSYLTYTPSLLIG